MEENVERYRIAPGALSDTASPTYLGNPDVVSALVGGFAANVEAMRTGLLSGSVSGEVAKHDLRAKIRNLADIFSGRDPGYQIIKGYNDVSLGPKLRADLGEYWQRSRAICNDDPVAGLFDWLAAVIMEKLKLADGDDMLLEVMLKPSMQYAVKVLLGIEARVVA